jgi:hypothetical protein
LGLRENNLRVKWGGEVLGNVYNIAKRIAGIHLYWVGL